MLAMLTVALIATLASTAFWLQWVDLENEEPARQRQQADWLLTAVQDWAVQLLAEDARESPGHDHRGERWAADITAHGLAAFLSRTDGSGIDADAPELLVSARLSDAQARLNLLALMVERSRNGEDESAVWARLFDALQLPDADREILIRRLPDLARSVGQPADASGQDLPLLPRRVDQLVWLGLDPASVAALAPHVTILPGLTPVNLNTASASVLSAVIPGLDIAAASRIALDRATQPWSTLDEARQALGPLGVHIHPSRHAVSSQYFLVRSQWRQAGVIRETEALVERQGENIRALWRRALPTLLADQRSTRP